MSDGRQRLSGTEYRKRKHEKEADSKKQSGSIKKMLSSVSSSLDISNVVVVVQPSKVFDSSSIVDATVPSKIAVTKNITKNVESNVCRGFENQNSFNSLIYISTHPAEWPLTINNDFKTLLVEKSPPAPLDANFVFPSDDQG